LPRSRGLDRDRFTGCIVNRLILEAQLVERGAMRYTPAGLPAFDMSLRHESELSEDGKARRVSFEIKARALGEITARLAQIKLGTAHRFAGFLSSQRNGRGIVFHVTEVG